jgi:CDP-diglyceride synthetase
MDFLYVFLQIFGFNFHLVLLPLIFSNSLHMILVKRDAFSFLELPINTRLFGANKTWRGVVIMSVSTELFVQLFWRLWNATIHLPLPPFGIGFWLGVFYVVGELPNSWFKRKLGIAAGETSKKYRWLFTALDKLDSSFSVAVGSIVLMIAYGLDDGKHSEFSLAYLMPILVLTVQNSITHWFFSWLLVKLKIKKTL